MNQTDNPTIMNKVRALLPICEARAADCCMEGMTDAEKRESVHDMILDFVHDHDGGPDTGEIAQIILVKLMGVER